MIAEKKVVNTFPPLWIRSPEKFVDAHHSCVLFSLWRMEQAGESPSLTQFLSHYIGSLPENLPPAILFDVTKWAIEGWEAWHAHKKEAVLA